VAIAVIFFSVIVASAVVYGGIRQTEKFTNKTLIVSVLLVIVAYVLLLVWQPGSLILSNAAVLAAAVMAGSLIGSLLKRQSSVIAFAITASIVDVLSFSGGLTNKIITNFYESKSLLLQFLAISIPLKGKTIPIVGIGDLLIMAALFYALLKLKYPGWHCFVVLLCGLLLALVLGLFTKGIFGIPFICGAGVIYLLISTNFKEK
jgi:hypothetical protein